MKRATATVRRRAVWPLTVMASLQAGCASLGVPSQPPGGYPATPLHPLALRLHEAVPMERATTAARQLAAEGLKALDARDYSKANALFNLALKVDINNSHLHLLNGLAYHLRGLAGEGALYAMAQQGYERAIEFDPSNLAARHQLGLLLMDRREYLAATQQLMEASLYAADDPDLLYDLAAAAYHAKQPRVAHAAMQGLMRTEGPQPAARSLRAAAIIAASAGHDDEARDHLRRYRDSGVGRDDADFTEQRVNAWKQAWRGGVQRVQFAPPGAPQINPQVNPQINPQGFPMGQPGVPQGMPGMQGMPMVNPFSGAAPTGYPPGYGQPVPFSGMQRPGGFFEKKMVMLDVVMVSAEEDNNDTFGINLLDGLRIQFGNPLGTAAASRTVTTNSDLINPANDVRSQVLTRVVSLPAITYTLNIANSQDRRNEVVARPTLVALGGQTSSFFSGTDVVGAAVSTGQGGSVQVQKEAGVRLAVTPEFMPDDLIRLQIVAERTFLTNPNSNVLFDFRLDTAKTLVSANVALKYGETLILSGLSERNLEATSSGVPGLRDVPLVQYLFNRQVKRDFNRSLLIMVTPRRPTYTQRSAEDIEADRGRMSEFERLQQEFEDKHKLWFAPLPNTVAAVQVLETSPVFREFRSGDLRLETWTSRASHAGRLKSALGFLYY
jgi:Tfp pilus assembly protein PilF